VREALRAAFFAHWWAFAVAGLVTAGVAMGVMLLRPPVWRVEAEVVLTDQTVILRTVNPFAAIEPPDAELLEFDQRALSTERLVAMVKRSGLADQFDAPQSLRARLESWVVARWGRPLTEPQRLDAAVELLRRRLRVVRLGRHVTLSVDWSDREMALQLARAALEGVLQVQRELGLQAGLAEVSATEGQLAFARRENLEVLKRVVAARAAGVPTAGSDSQAQRDGQLREQALLDRAKNQNLALEVARRANALKAVVVRVPALPRVPVSALPSTLVLVWVVLSLLTALAGPAFVALGTAQHLPPWVTALGLVGLAGLSGLATGVADGDWVTALTPLGWAATLWAVWLLPLKWPMLALFFAVITCDDPSDRAYAAQWHSPLYDVGRALFTNVAWFTGFELRLGGLAALMVVRQVLGSRLDPVEGRAPKPLRQAMLGSLVVVVLWVALGMIRGGEFRQALWQFRFLVMLPVIAMLAMQAFAFPQDLGKVLTVLLVGSLIKSGLGVYFMLVIAPTLERFPPHTSGHNDTMLLVTAVVVPLVLLWERPTLARLILLLLWVPPLALAIRYNDRRIAYVDLLGCAAAIFLVSPRHRVKRFVMRAGVVLVPLALLYLSVGWNREGQRAFALAQTVRSLVSPVEGSKNESSNVERDIENYNLVRSWRGNAVFGQGFGHAFTEYLPSNDFKQSNFGHIGHNSLLWLLWIGGIFGFTGMLLYVGVALFFFTRTLQRATATNERAALLIALSVMVTFLNQCFGDMGTQSTELAFFVALAVAIIGRLATKHGAWVEATRVSG
jgi:O-Antigen ligase